MKRSKKVFALALVAAVIAGGWMSHRFSVLRETYIRDAVRADYEGLLRVIQHHHDVCGYKFEVPAARSHTIYTPYFVEAELKVGLPDEAVARNNLLQFLTHQRPLCSIDSNYTKHSAVDFGSHEGNSYIYRWRFDF